MSRYTLRLTADIRTEYWLQVLDTTTGTIIGSFRSRDAAVRMIDFFNRYPEAA